MRKKIISTRKSYNFSKTGLLLAALFCLLLCVSCLEIDTQLNFKNDGSGQIKLTFKGEEALFYPDGRENPSHQNIFPVSKDDFALTAQSIAGLELNHWQEEKQKEKLVIKVIMSFDNPNALQQFAGQGLILAQKQGTWHFDYQLESLGLAGLDPEIAEIYQNQLSTLKLDYQITGPGKISASNLPELKGKSIFQFTIDSSMLTQNQQKLVWHAEWK